MDRSVVMAIAVREARGGLRNRWFLLYAAAFVVLIVAFAWVALAGSNVAGQAGFGRTAAGLLNLLLLMVPLIGLTIGAQTLVAERQDRTLDYLLAQPVSAAEVFVGKYLGAAALMALILAIGFGWAGAALALRGAGGSLGNFGVLILLTTLLALGMLSVGYLVSSVTRQTSAALGIVVTLWLVLVIVGDLGLMGSALVMGLRPDSLLALTLVNPLDTYKLVSVQILQTSLEVLGPAGVYAIDRFGARLTPVLLAIEAVWVVLPLPIGYWLFKRTDVH
ncbi:ABC transporter permease [Sphaerobacter thermophilus]|uniref:ABC-2 type transporter n=1 Tax=Sphaerobacter thermophilus (strain ATCC 49802 / DSM 20745 / KCCM 41009 / NCIMB 13125 / S 6022) TaxID=479434 RepID=D1C1Q8_SPHTD|nr:ABC transporter permease subunit [Sphaerobacter thermophilus]ACZ38175.1 ABC-2 type transporter [Sphaerobacter thermophilus DSM 20745]